MKYLPIKCSGCGKIFFRYQGRINEGMKRNWRSFCSLQCLGNFRNKQKILKCDNPNCNKTFKRQPHEISSSENHFCSRSCSATVNNPKSPKRRPKIRICLVCREKYTGRRKYCSNKCWPRKLISKKQIINEIKEFYKENGRIPFKRECGRYRSARRNFGTWNKAIKASGYEPNPVVFAKKFIADDGHICDSLTEKIIDDWLFRRKIKHEINVPYPGSKSIPSLTADFVVENLWIEFFGLNGKDERYDKNKRKKLKLVMKYNLNLIEIYPQDLFPENKLGEVLYCLNPVF